MNFQQPITKRMNRKGWNRSRLAKEAGISKGGLSDLLNSNESVSFPRLIKIADALEVSVWRMVREAEQADKEGK